MGTLADCLPHPGEAREDQGLDHRASHDQTVDACCSGGGVDPQRYRDIFAAVLEYCVRRDEWAPTPRRSRKRAQSRNGVTAVEAPQGGW